MTQLNLSIRTIGGPVVTFKPNGEHGRIAMIIGDSDMLPGDLAYFDTNDKAQRYVGDIEAATATLYVYDRPALAAEVSIDANPGVDTVRGYFYPVSAGLEFWANVLHGATDAAEGRRKYMPAGSASGGEGKITDYAPSLLAATGSATASAVDATRPTVGGAIAGTPTFTPTETYAIDASDDDHLHVRVD